MQVRKTLGRVAAITGVVLAASAAMSLPAQATTPTAAVAATNTVGPYSTWGACDSDRRLYSSRYGYKTYDCFLHTNGYYYFKYEPK